MRFLDSVAAATASSMVFGLSKSVVSWANLSSARQQKHQQSVNTSGVGADGEGGGRREVHPTMTHRDRVSLTGASSFPSRAHPKVMLMPPQVFPSSTRVLPLLVSTTRLATCCCRPGACDAEARLALNLCVGRAALPLPLLRHKRHSRCWYCCCGWSCWCGWCGWCGWCCGCGCWRCCPLQFRRQGRHRRHSTQCRAAA